jgi:alpha-L-fucosidase
MMPTKERLARNRARELEQKRLDEIFGSLAEQSDNVDLSLNKIAEDIRIYQGGLVAFDEEGEPYLHENTGKGGNDERRDNRKDAALELRRKYKDIWGKRGAARKIICNEKLSSKEKVKLSIRTVQQYIKDFPVK